MSDTVTKTKTGLSDIVTRKKVSVRLETELIEALNIRAQACHTTFSEMIRRIVAREFRSRPMENQASKPEVTTKLESTPAPVNGQRVEFVRQGNEWFPPGNLKTTETSRFPKLGSSTIPNDKPRVTETPKKLTPSQ